MGGRTEGDGALPEHQRRVRKSGKMNGVHPCSHEVLIPAGKGRSMCVDCGLDPEAPVVGIRSMRTGAVMLCELADRPTAWSRGLSYRPHIGSGRGMLFDLRSSRVACFQCWFMRFPIDITAMCRDGIVRRVLPSCRPGRLHPIFLGWHIRYVLETPAGGFPATPGDVIKIG